MKKVLNYLCISMVVLVMFSCKPDAGTPQGKDPIIGNWKLRALTVNGQTADVTNRPCFKDSYMNFNATKVDYKLSVSFDDGPCQTEAETLSWKNKNGSYYYISDGQEYPISFNLTDNNATLNWVIEDEGTNVTLTFRKQ